MASTSGAIRAGRAFIELFTDDTKLQRGLNIASKKISTFGNGITAMGKRIALLGASAAAPLGLAVAKASELEETMNKFNVVFGGNAKNVKEWSDKFAGAMGRSRQQVADFLASTQTLVVPMGFDPKEAEDFSKTIAGLAFDLASFHNTSDEDAFAALKSGLVGESEPLKRFGVLLSEAALKQELFNQGIDPNKATNYEKAMGRLAIIMRSTATAQGDVQRSFGSVANQMKAARASVDNAAAAIGTALLPVIARLLGAITPIIEGVARWATANPELITTIAAAAAGVATLGVSLAVIGPIIATIGASFGALATALGIVLNPITLVVGAIAGIGIAVAHMTGDLDAAVQTVKGIFGEMQSDASQAFGGIAEALKAGDIEGAFAILGTVLKLEWLRVLNELEQMWGAFADKAKVIAYSTSPTATRADIDALEKELAAERQSQANYRNAQITGLEGQLGSQVGMAGGTQEAPLGPDGKPLPAFDQFGAPNPGFDMQGNYTGKRVQRVENTDDSSGMAAGIPATGMNALAASFTSAVSNSISTAGEFLTSDRIGKGRNAPLGLSGLLSGGLSTASDFLNQIGGGVAVAEQAVAKSSSAGSFNGVFAGQQLSGQQTEKQIAENTKQSAKYLKDMARRDNLGFV